MSEHSKEKYKVVNAPNVTFQAQRRIIGGREVQVVDGADHFLAYVNKSQLRDAEIAAFDVQPSDADAFFEVDTDGPMTVIVRVSQPSFDAIQRARPIIDIKKA